MEPDMEPDIPVAEAEAAPIDPDPETVAIVPDTPREARAIPLPTEEKVVHMDEAGVENGVWGVTVCPTVNVPMEPPSPVYVPVYRWAKVEVDPLERGKIPGG
jgi:hypothetical protein